MRIYQKYCKGFYIILRDVKLRNLRSLSLGFYPRHAFGSPQLIYLPYFNTPSYFSLVWKR